MPWKNPIAANIQNKQIIIIIGWNYACFFPDWANIDVLFILQEIGLRTKLILLNVQKQNMPTHKNSKLCQSKEELLTCKIVTRWPSHWQLSVTCLSMLCSAAWLKLTAPTSKCERMWIPLTSRSGNHKNWREFYWTNKTKSRSKLVISGDKALTL